jgi:hypothetical protein
MLDMLLSFFTAYIRQGTLVTDRRQIVLHYLRTWFVADFAGSFPFELIIESFDQRSLFPLIKAVKFLRMLKVVKGLTFVNRVGRLRRAQGSEGLTIVIGVMRSMFVMVFTAHVLGCMFILLASASPSSNWLLRYAPEAVDASAWTRYNIALYWAIVTIRPAIRLPPRPAPRDPHLLPPPLPPAAPPPVPPAAAR